MDDERRARFKAWFKSTYGDTDESRAKFMADSAKHGREALSKGRVTQLFDDDEPFGERAAKSLSDRFGLDEDFFLKDSAADAKPVERAAANLQALLRINPETFDSLVADIERITEGAKAADRVIKTKTKTNYVTSARAAETLGKAATPIGKEKPSDGGQMLGGRSQFGGLNDAPATKKGKR